MIKTKLKIAYNQAIEHLRQKDQYINSKCYGKPTDISFIVTSKCNLKCKYCDYWKQPIKKELTIKEWKNIILNLKRWLGSYHLSISGGEPLLFKDLFELIKFASENEILVSLITNGVLINENLASKIAKSGVYNVIFSLDGLKETNDSIRGEGSYDKTIFGINLLIKLKIPACLSLATVISSRNLNELTSMVKYAKDSGLKFIYFQPLTFNPRSTYKKDWHMKNSFWPRDTEKVNSIIDELIYMKRRNYPIANPINQLELMKDYFRNPIFSTNKCFVGLKNLNIDETGNITTCYYMEPIENIFKNNIKGLWYSKKANEIREKIKNCKRGCSVLNCNYTKSLSDKFARLF